MSGLVPIGYQQITSLSAATGLTVPAGAITAIVQATGQAVRFRDDGTNPTASVGETLGVGLTATVSGRETLAAIRFIETAASAKLDVSYYGGG